MTVQICRAATGPTACYAERELKRYLRKYSGAAFGEGAELTFRLEVDESLPAHCYGWRWEGSSLTLRGGSESALLCCVYQLLSQLGICFFSTASCTCRSQLLMPKIWMSFKAPRSPAVWRM